jgi:hypothetical protein
MREPDDNYSGREDFFLDQVIPHRDCILSFSGTSLRERRSFPWPNREFFARISQHVSSRPAVTHFWTG